MKIRILILIVLSFFCLTFIYSQDLSPRKLIKQATELFNNEEFEKALPLFLESEKNYPNNFEIKYYIGACYLNSKYEKVKGIPYLEYALIHGEKSLPKAVFLDLGLLYHLNYQFDEAIHSFEKYIKLADRKDFEEAYARRMIDICNNAKHLIKDSLKVDIYKIGKPIKSDDSEITPFISADENILLFTRINFRHYKSLILDSIVEIKISYFKSGKWTEPQNLILPESIKDKKVTLAGLSPDGQILYLSIGNNTNSNLYQCNLSGNTISNLSPLKGRVNSDYYEGSCSITPDGQSIYFSSNRPGGYGGMDIYKSLLNDKEEWGEPINLGSSVNTELDEISPFIHPDRRTLFFSSNGHNTIGGFDIFQSIYLFDNNSWSIPHNIGFPINTTSDDKYFVLSADGNNAYFSSSKESITGTYDLYKATLKQTIPLTLVKGTITGGTPAKPIKCNIKVIDNKTKERIKYVYNPNPNTGKYLMIFPPNNNYDMIIEAEDYFTYNININVPNQTYFYELYQEIHLDKIQINKNTKDLAQEITVTNIFHDVLRERNNDVFFDGFDTSSTRYDKLLDLIETIIETTDSLEAAKLDTISYNFNIEESEYSLDAMDKLLLLIEEAIETTDTVRLSYLDQTAIYNERSKKVYFFDAETGKPDLSYIIVDKDTIYTLPTFNTDLKQQTILYTLPDDTTEVIAKKETIKTVNFNFKYLDNRKLINTSILHFESNSSVINPKYYSHLSEVLKLMIENPSLGVEIHGYTDTRGDKDKNMELSKQRAFSALKYFIDNFIPPNRAYVKGFGEAVSVPEKNDAELRNNRRVELLLYEFF